MTQAWARRRAWARCVPGRPGSAARRRWPGPRRRRDACDADDDASCPAHWKIRYPKPCSLPAVACPHRLARCTRCLRRGRPPARRDQTRDPVRRDPSVPRGCSDDHDGRRVDKSPSHRAPARPLGEAPHRNRCAGPAHGGSSSSACQSISETGGRPDGGRPLGSLNAPADRINTFDRRIGEAMAGMPALYASIGGGATSSQAPVSISTYDRRSRGPDSEVPFAAVAAGF